MQFINEVYVNFEDDLRDSLRYFNPDAGFLPKGLEVGVRVRDFAADLQPDEEHKEITDYIAGSLKGDKTDDLGGYVLRAANLRKFLG
ncbi:MAG: hypothetical protein DRO76_05255 [Candidatus Altiarchaeales archaeon]|nr:MAG: hypothetical protein DRO76_05255 [Candidatus Altiarchaeales archaeon]